MIVIPQWPEHSIGADPELFVAQNGRVIGCEKVIPEDGLKSNSYASALVVRDGVQMELHPAQSYNVQGLVVNLANCFHTLKTQLDATGAQVLLKTLVDVGRPELRTLSDEARELGCMPSNNVYGNVKFKFNKKRYTKRSLGGHIHVSLTEVMQEEVKGIVQFCDIIAGTFMTMIDRDSTAAERRENYGRAGEYRTPSYGMEWRTPSAFWLRHSTLTSFMAEITLLSVLAYKQMYYGKMDIYEDLASCVSIDKIRIAIDQSNYQLAKENLASLQPFIEKHVPDNAVVGPKTLEKFVRFADGVEKNGIEYYFPEDMMTHWLRIAVSKTPALVFVPFARFLEGV